MVFLRFPYSFPIVFLWFSDGCQKVLRLFFNHLPMISPWFSNAFPSDFLMFFLLSSNDFPTISLWCSYGFPMMFIWFPIFPMILRWFSCHAPIMFWWFSHGFPSISFDCLTIFLWYSYNVLWFPMIFLPDDFLMISRSFSDDAHVILSWFSWVVRLFSYGFHLVS